MRKLLRLPDSLLKYLVSAIIIAVPLYPKFPFIGVPGTFVSVRGEDVLIMISFLVWLAFFFPGIKSFFKNDVFRTVTLFLVVGAISLFSATFITHTVTPHIGVLHWLRRIEYFVPLFLGMTVIKREPGNLNFYLKIIFLVIFFAFVYGFGQRYFSWPIIITQNQEYSKGVALRWMPGSHINSTFAGHYDLATFLVLVLPVVITSLFILKNKLVKLFLLAIWLMSLWLLVNTASRISLVSYLVATTFSLVLIKKYKVIPVVLLISLSFIGFSSNLQERYTRIWGVVRERVFEVKIIDNLISREIYAQVDEESLYKKDKPSPTPTPVPVFEDRSSSIRLNVEWPRAIRAFSKNPLLGTGFSSITLATDNDYLRALGEVGFLGLLSFSLIFITIFKEFLGVFPLQEYFNGLNLAFVSGMVAAIPGIFLNAIFIDVFEASKFAIIFWLLMGMAISLITNKK